MFFCSGPVFNGTVNIEWRGGRGSQTKNNKLRMFLAEIDLFELSVLLESRSLPPENKKKQAEAQSSVFDFGFVPRNVKERTVL